MSDLHIGFTGTKNGMTDDQRNALWRYMAEYRQRMGEDVNIVLHHGDCVGADDEAHTIAARSGWHVALHPGTDGDGNSPYRAHAEDRESAHVWAVNEPAPYPERNMDIVLSSMMVLAAPKSSEEVRRSGTWSTVRAAVKMGRPVILFLPDGDMTQMGDWSHGHEDE